MSEPARAQVVVDEVHAFATIPDGTAPNALIQASDGNFYGTTGSGGQYFGTVFKLTPDGTFSILHRFVNAAQGALPAAGLIQATDGNLYGTTSAGGAFAHGTIFRMALDGTFTLLHSFSGGADGANPQAALLQASDGNFYGTTVNGGASDLGTVFRTTPDGTVTVLHEFEGVASAIPPGTGGDGANPRAALIQATDGDFYGTTATGGQQFLGSGPGQGTIFRMTATGSLEVVHDFGVTDGETPTAALVQGRDGWFYGTTSTGGVAGAVGGQGTAFVMESAPFLYAFVVLHTFTGTPDGSFPLAPLIQSIDGNFYGTTSGGGSPGYGTMFKMTADGTVSVLHSFSNGTDGNLPQTPLLEATDGALYGTTTYGGTFGAGSIFRARTCRVSLRLTYGLGTLGLNFTYQSAIPATWSTWFVYVGGVVNLWSVSAPAVPSDTGFLMPIPGIPAMGNVGVLTMVGTPTDGVVCSDFGIVNTGGAGPTAAALRDLVISKALLP